MNIISLCKSNAIIKALWNSSRLKCMEVYVQPMTLCSHSTKIQFQTWYLRWGWFLRWILYLFVNQMPLWKHCEIHQYWNAWRFVHDHKITLELWWSYLTTSIIVYNCPHHITIFFSWWFQCKNTKSPSYMISLCWSVVLKHMQWFIAQSKMNSKTWKLLYVGTSNTR